MKIKIKMNITEGFKELLIDTAKKLKGSDRRKFMAKAVNELGYGGQIFAEKELKWCRDTIRKGQKELRTEIDIVDNFSAKGRKRLEDKFSYLLNDIKEIVEPETQTDPTFKTTRLYTRLTAKEVRRQLIEGKGYKETDFCESSIENKLNYLGYNLKSILKTKPQKKFQKPT